MKLRILASLALATAATIPAPAQQSSDDYGSRTVDFCDARKPVSTQTSAAPPKRPARKRPTRVQAVASSAPVRKPGQLGYTLFQRVGGGRPVRIDPIKGFRLGDGVRLSIESSIDGYLYVFNSTDQNQNPAMIFPHVRLGGGQNYIQAHVPYEVPSRHNPEPKNQWFEFTGNPGVDRLYFIVSSDPLDGVPIADELKAASQEAALRGIKDFYWEPDPAIWQWINTVSADALVARSKAYGQALTQKEDGAAARELRLAPSDPPPSVLCVNKRAEDVVVTFVDLRYGK
jgi:hypothetical protein